MADFMDNREPEMIPIVERLAAIPELDDTYASDMMNCGEWQEALESYLQDAARKQVELPNDLISSIRSISDKLLPKAIRNHELVAA